MVQLGVGVALLVSDSLLDEPDEVLLGLVEGVDWAGRHLGKLSLTLKLQEAKIDLSEVMRVGIFLSFIPKFCFVLVFLRLLVCLENGKCKSTKVHF